MKHPCSEKRQWNIQIKEHCPTPLRGAESFEWPDYATRTEDSEEMVRARHKFARARRFALAQRE